MLQTSGQGKRQESFLVKNKKKKRRAFIFYLYVGEAHTSPIKIPMVAPKQKQYYALLHIKSAYLTEVNPSSAKGPRHLAL